MGVYDHYAQCAIGPCANRRASRSPSRVGDPGGGSPGGGSCAGQRLAVRPERRLLQRYLHDGLRRRAEPSCSASRRGPFARPLAPQCAKCPAEQPRQTPWRVACKSPPDHRRAPHARRTTCPPANRGPRRLASAPRPHTSLTEARQSSRDSRGGPVAAMHSRHAQFPALVPCGHERRRRLHADLRRPRVSLPPTPSGTPASSSTAAPTSATRRRIFSRAFRRRSSSRSSPTRGTSSCSCVTSRRTRGGRARCTPACGRTPPGSRSLRRSSATVASGPSRCAKRGQGSGPR